MSRFRPSAAAPREARRWVAETGADLPPPTCEAVALLVSEVVTNSVLHGGLGPEDDVEVRMERRRGRIHVEVRDPGSGFEPSTALPPGARSPHRWWEHGYGLRIVDSLATSWGVDESRPTTVWFELRPEG